MAFQFYALNQTSRSWQGICAAYNGDVYAGVGAATGLWIRPNGEDTFVELKDSGDASYPQNIYGLVGLPNGDIYRTRNGFINKKRTGGTGDFVDYPVNGDTFSLMGLAYSPITGYIYQCHFNGPGVSRFLPTHDPNHAHVETPSNSANQTFEACVSKDGDVYITCHQGNGPGGGSLGYCAVLRGETGLYVNLENEYFPDIGGTGAWQAWQGCGAATNGDVYISNGTTVFRQAYGTNTFLTFQSLGFRSIHGAPDGSVYGTISSGDIWKLDSPTSKLTEYAQIIG